VVARIMFTLNRRIRLDEAAQRETISSRIGLRIVAPLTNECMLVVAAVVARRGAIQPPASIHHMQTDVGLLILDMSCLCRRDGVGPAHVTIISALVSTFALLGVGVIAR